jgi:hypothetical protein
MVMANGTNLTDRGMVMPLTGDHRETVLAQLTAAFAYHRRGLPTAGWWGDVPWGGFLPAWYRRTKRERDHDADYAEYVLRGLEEQGAFDA